MAEQTVVIRWEDPKPSQARGAGAPWSRYNTVAAELRGQPGRWAAIAESSGRNRTSLANHVRAGSIACFTPAGDFDAVSRQVFGVTTIYARYVGDPEANDA